ncbi:hypothetical protein IQ216_12740 [Cyanobium sp. LEGE 06143]|uniref:hypothetical protein n=1 Tax=Cyanobium sp. LEGE 06143 TaxID=945727 RepID=UPI00187E00F8|nr:hypothetical protein [Cyanobium sp. LEGE 06143]MBE9173902.1 hypothetical protein [Cyanobium sp. LEGE 06143]
MTVALSPDLHVRPRSALSPGRPQSRRVPTNPQPVANIQVQISQLDTAARQAAAEGQVAESARLILELLKSERRLANTGPQVLQLIKPRG